MIQTILIVVACVLLFPFIVYFTAKLAVFGALSAKRLFDEQQKRRS